jgi:ABC-type transport system involved in multi-copper enzyme maturation permease subunit
MYSVTAYYLAKILVETPVLALTPMIFALIVYFGVGLTITASQFFIFYASLFLIVQCAASWGYFVSSIFEKEEMATSLSPIIIMPLILFGGQFANSKNIQPWISWFQYISPIRYGLEAMTVNEFDSRIYNTTMIIRNILTNTTQVLQNSGNMMLKDGPGFNSSQWIVTKYPEINPAVISGFDVGVWQCLVILLALTIALRILSLIFLKLLVSKFQ